MVSRSALLLAAGVLLGSSQVYGQTAADKETARALMDEGDKYYEARDYARALKSYQAAHDIMGVPTTGVEVARAQVALGLLVEAADTALAVTRIPVTGREPAAFARARNEASELSVQLVRRIPAITIAVQGVDADTSPSATLDGTALKGDPRVGQRKLNPGAHTLIIEAPGYRTGHSEFSVKEGETKALSVVLERAPESRAPAAGVSPSDTTVSRSAAPPSSGGGTPALAYIGFAMGGVGVGLGSVAGIMSLARAGDAKDNCNGDECDPSARDDIASSKRLATVSNVGFGVGVLGIAVGTIALLSGGRSEPANDGAATRTLVPVIGFGMAGVRGRF